MRIATLAAIKSVGVCPRLRPRAYSSSCRDLSPRAGVVTIRWFDRKNGVTVEKQAAIGTSLLESAHASGIDLEGACEGSIACSTCHVILEPSIFDKLDPASEVEEDMLDCAFGLTET